METKYICTNNNCSYPGAHQFEMSFKSESIMDANNVATAFCPFCKKEMVPAPDVGMDCDPKKDANCNPAG